ncbi:MAG TPA: YraN family protein [Bryobacteraceae bacterium]|nr:YraN family protein [Bryobacteraceae bacterium]
MIRALYRAADAVRHRLNPDDHGRLGEDLAHRYLQKQGVTIVARRYRPPGGGGEIDLVGWQGETLVLVEVKTRATAEFGMPERAVDADKERYLRHAGRDFARRAGVEWGNVRFDIVSIVLTDPPFVEWFPDAFAPDRPRPAGN